MNWSAEDALNRMWSEMDANVTNGEMRAFLKRHLQAAHDAALAAAQTRIAALEQALATCDGKVIVGPLRFMDGLDAGLAVERWIEKNARTHADDPTFSIERFGLRFDDPTAQPNGGVTVLWAGTQQIGIAVVTRDEMNFSVLTIIVPEARATAKAAP